MMATEMTILFRTTALLVSVWLLTGEARAQGQGDKMREILEIAERTSEQLREVDRLLLESSTAQQARARPIALLEQSRERNVEATQSIEELVEKLTELKNECGGSGT